MKVVLRHVLLPLIAFVPVLPIRAGQDESRPDIVINYLAVDNLVAGDSCP